MDEGLRQIVAVLAVAMLVALGARRLALPYTVGLVVAGAAIAATRPDFGLTLTHDAIFDLILPPLLFEAAVTLRWSDLRRDLAPIALLATLGTAVAAALIAAVMTVLAGWPLPAALLFGALIAATDPVAIIAMFKDNGVEGRLRRLVEAESLFNDGAAAVLFVMALAFAQDVGGARSAADVWLSIVRIGVGGALVGTAVGGLAIAAAWRTSEHMIEAALTMIAAYGSFLAAEYVHVSGVLAVVTTGLIMGNLGLLAAQERSYMSRRGREFVLDFWEFAAFFANSAVFLLIGVNVAHMTWRAHAFWPLLLAIAASLAARAVTVYPLAMAFWPTRWKITLGEQHVLWWGGLRGALALALALALPPDLPLRDDIVFITFGVVAFSIVAQGLTMPMLLRRLGFVDKRDEH